MGRFEPVLDSKEAGQAVRDFVSSHRADLKMLFAFVFPYLLVLTALSICFDYRVQMDTILYMEEVTPPQTSQEMIAFINEVANISYSSVLFYISFLVKILIGYCFATIAVSWHRLVLLGRERYEPMLPLSPTRNEIEFIAVWTIVGTILPFLFGFLSGINLWFVVLTSLILPYFMFKMSFYFPAKALDSHLPFKYSFRLTKGYFWKFFLTNLRTFWRVMGVMFLLSLIAGFVGGALTPFFFVNMGDSSFIKGAYSQAVVQPIQTVLTTFIFQPLFTVLGVTVLSNYYQHALRSKNADEAL